MESAPLVYWSKSGKIWDGKGEEERNGTERNGNRTERFSSQAMDENRALSVQLERKKAEAAALADGIATIGDEYKEVSFERLSLTFA